MCSPPRPRQRGTLHVIGGPERFEPDPFGSLPTEELALARLPPGRHCLPRSFVLRSQRLRIVAGMLHGLHEHSYPGTTIGHITAEARVSPGRFLPGVRRQGGLLLATSDAVSRWVCERVEAAVAGAADWEGVHAGAAEGLGLLADNPEVARIFTVKVAQAGAAARELSTTSRSSCWAASFLWTPAMSRGNAPNGSPRPRPRPPRSWSSTC